VTYYSKRANPKGRCDCELFPLTVVLTQFHSASIQSKHVLLSASASQSQAKGEGRDR